MTTTSIVQHRSDYHFVKLEEDYIAICSQGKQYPHCKAFILSILERWITDKKAKGRDCSVYMTYQQWIEAMYGLYRRSMIINCLAELVEEGLIKKHPCRYAGKDSYEYTLAISAIQQRINDLPTKTEQGTRVNIDPFKFKRVQKQTNEEETHVNLHATHVNLNPSHPQDAFKSKRIIDSITENTPIDLSSPSSNAQHTDAFLVPTLPLRDELRDNTSSYSHEPAESVWLCETEGETDIFSEEDADPTEKRPVVQQGGNLAPGEGRARPESEERREGSNSNEHPAVKPTGGGPPPASPGRAAPLREQPTLQSTPHEKPRQATRTPEPETSKPPLPDKTDGKGNRKKDAALLCEPSKIRKLIDTNRGYALTHNGAKINQNKVLNEWCQHFCLEHYYEVMNHLKTCRCKNPSHEWWHKDEHWRYLDADNLAKLTPGVLSELGLVPKPELPPDIPMPAAPVPPNGKYHPYTRASMYEPIEIGV